MAYHVPFITINSPLSSLQKKHQESLGEIDCKMHFVELMVTSHQMTIRSSIFQREKHMRNAIAKGFLLHSSVWHAKKTFCQNSRAYRPDVFKQKTHGKHATPKQSFLLFPRPLFFLHGYSRCFLCQKLWAINLGHIKADSVERNIRIDVLPIHSLIIT